VTKGCIFNELCWSRHAGQSAPDHRLLFDMADIVHCIGCGPNGFRVRLEVLDRPTGDGITFRKWGYQALQTIQDRELRRFLYSMLTSTYSPGRDFGRATYSGQEAMGLYDAYREDQLAVSLLSAACWDTETLSIIVREEPKSREVAPRSVHHASRLPHLKSHIDWLSSMRSARERLSLLLRCSEFPPEHTPASCYSRGKHVSGQTNEERKARAGSPGGAGQFRAFLDDGTRVTDEMIAKWEKKALDAVRDATRDSLGIKVEIHSSSTFYITIVMKSDIGYSGGMGTPTARMRVEISQWTVHSHPF
jgi:hypothetical protein